MEQLCQSYQYCSTVLVTVWTLLVLIVLFSLHVVRWPWLASDDHVQMNE